MKLLLSFALLTGLAAAQTPPTAPPTAAQPAARPPRPAPPTRDPNTPGYVKARELPDGTNAPAKQNGNFILGPTHPADPATVVREGVPKGEIFEFKMESTDSGIYPGIAREPGTFGTGDPANPYKLIVATSHPRSLHPPCGRLRSEAIRSRHCGAVHCRCRWHRSDVVHHA